MTFWLLLSVLVVLVFVILEALVIRSHRATRQRIDFFYTLHRLLIQHRWPCIEDVIVLAFSAFVGLFVFLLLIGRFKLELGETVAADNLKRPSREMVQNIKSEDLFELEGGDHLPLKRYEEYAFDVKPAQVFGGTLSWEAEDLIVLGGKKVLQDSASGGMSVRAIEGESAKGDLVVSDNTVLQPAGDYEARFFLHFQGALGEAAGATLQIWDHHEALKLAERQIKASEFSSDGYQALGVKYHRASLGSLEIKVVYEGKGILSFDRLEVQPQAAEFEPIDLNQFYGDVVDKAASEGLVRQAIFGKDIPGRIAFGPYDENIPSGYYRATFRLKVSDNQKSLPVALIDIASNASGFLPAYKEIRPTDFPEENRYQDFDLDFYKPDGGYLEFRVYYYGVTDLFFDRVDLKNLKPKS